MSEISGDRLPRPVPGSHPEPDALFRARRSPADPRSASVLNHVAVCAPCSEELVRLDAFEKTPVDPLLVSASRARAAWDVFSGKRKRSFWIPVPALAAAGAILIAAGLVFVPKSPPDVVRGGNAGSSFSPVGDIADAPLAFLFPKTDVESVRITVFDAERTYTWTSPPSRPDGPVAFPKDQRAKLKPGVTYTWAVLEEGTTLPAQTFRIGR